MGEHRLRVIENRVLGRIYGHGKDRKRERTNYVDKYFIHLPMKMEPIVSSEMSAIRTQTPGNYPKRNKLYVDKAL